MKDSTRRHFLQKSALAGLGTTAVTNAMATGETEAESALRGLDGELARALRSYGRTRTMVDAGNQKTKVGPKTIRFPAFRLGVDVRNPKSCCQSFDTLSRLSDAVMANGNTLKFARGGRYFVIEHCVAQGIVS